MKLYNQEGVQCTAEKEQLPIMLEAGWSRTKPEPVEEVKEAEKGKETAPIKKIAKKTPVIRK